MAMNSQHYANGTIVHHIPCGSRVTLKGNTITMWDNMREVEFTRQYDNYDAAKMWAFVWAKILDNGYKTIGGS